MLFLLLFGTNLPNSSEIVYLAFVNVAPHTCSFSKLLLIRISLLLLSSLVNGLSVNCVSLLIKVIDRGLLLYII